MAIEPFQSVLLNSGTPYILIDVGTIPSLSTFKCRLKTYFLRDDLYGFIFYHFYLFLIIAPSFYVVVFFNLSDLFVCFKLSFYQSL